MKKKPTLKRIALLTLFLTFSVVLGYIDALIPLPFLPLPGLKLGLSNLAILVALILFSPTETAAISLLRILIVHLLLFPSPNGLILSLCGGVLSFAAMVLFQKLRFPPISISICGSIAHNLGQVLAAVLILKTPALLFCLCWLLPVGVLCGGLIGLLGAEVSKRLKKTPHFRDVS